MESSRRGTIASWFADKRYGFLRPEGGGRQIFAHDSAVADPTLILAPEVEVAYEIELDARGRALAVDVRSPDFRPGAPVEAEGIVDAWRGTYGLILDLATARRLLCHFRDVVSPDDGYRELREGQRVAFEVERA